MASIKVNNPFEVRVTGVTAKITAVKLLYGRELIAVP